MRWRGGKLEEAGKQWESVLKWDARAVKLEHGCEWGLVGSRGRLRDKRVLSRTGRSGSIDEH